jgi:hypothetical protein
MKNQKNRAPTFACVIQDGGHSETVTMENAFKGATVLYEISRYEVENCLTERITHDLRIAVDNPFCACEMDGMIFSVRGYDDDPRELFQIPEFRNFVRKLNNPAIPWVYLACLETLWLQVLALCLVDNAATVTDTQKGRTRMAFPGPDVAGFLEAQMEAFGSMCALQGVPPKQSEARVRAVCESFGFELPSR